MKDAVENVPLPERLRAAVAAFRAHKGKCRTLAAQYGVPQSTLSRHVLKPVGYVAIRGRPPALTLAMERLLVKRALTATDQGRSWTAAELTIMGREAARGVAVGFKGTQR